MVMPAQYIGAARVPCFIDTLRRATLSRAGNGLARALQMNNSRRSFDYYAATVAAWRRALRASF